jgi:hypothetical protein
MKLLDVPHTTEDMRYSVGITGVTILTQSRFKYRHNGAREIEQVPGKGFQIRVPLKSAKKSHFRRGKLSKGIACAESLHQVKKVKVSQYRIDKKEVTHRIRGYINQMKGEKLLYFWTVSFPIHTTDDTAYILLNKWLTRLRQENMLKEYLWIAERQQNNTIHFHIVINNRMDVKKANKFMRAAIMYSIDKHEINYTREQAKNYNGVDICKDRKTRRVTNFAKQNRQKSLSNYLTKYITKNDSTFTHLAWHSSRGYSNLIIAVRFTESEYVKSNTHNLLNTESPLQTEYYIHYRWKALPPTDLLTYLKLINQHVQEII